MEVKLKEVRTVLEGELTSVQGVLSLDFSQKGSELPEYIGISVAFKEEGKFLSGGYYPVGDSINLNFNACDENAGNVINEIYAQCKSVCEVKVKK
ncbi:hypothetical protein [Myroides odoratimimus]|uniref:hypothetical protein n=1 Tax=Myroides odoratimimus TaxID=76832 RepID=UPI003F42F968